MSSGEAKKKNTGGTLNDDATFHLVEMINGLDSKKLKQSRARTNELHIARIKEDTCHCKKNPFDDVAP